MKPAEIQARRERANVSRAVFARHPDVTTGLASHWERGERRSSGPASTMLSLIGRKGLEVSVE